MYSEFVSSKSPAGDVRSEGPSVPTIAEESRRDSLTISTGPKILIVEDDVSLAKFLSRELVLKHISVQLCHDGETACDDLRDSTYDLVVLDLNLPVMDGIAVLKHIRLNQPRLPVLVLTARSRTADLVLALDQGADDCLIKPFSLLELMARIRGLLRRMTAPDVSASNIGDLTINREEHWVLRGDRRINLTVREFDLLEYLMKNAGKAVSRETLMRDVWNMPFNPATNIVDVYMKYLRDKVDIAGETKLIRTVRGIGYVFSND
jgi:DNA-binding response OmpR family regulator